MRGFLFEKGQSGQNVRVDSKVLRLPSGRAVGHYCHKASNMQGRGRRNEMKGKRDLGSRTKRFC